jgi:hypothetical protein
MRPMPSVLDLVTGRLALPRSRSGLLGTERVLASVRVVLAISSLLLLRLDPAQAFPYDLAQAFLLLYLAHSIGLFVVLHLRNEISSRFPLVVHTVDVIWPAIISLFGSGASSPFFLYFIFALLAAAFRWGMRETALTTVAVIGTMGLDAITRAHTPLVAIVGEASVTNFIMRSVYVVIFSFLIGYISESEKRRAAEAMSVSRISSRVRIEAGLKGTVQTVMHELLGLFGSRELLVISRETEGRLVMLWRAERARNNGSVVFTWRQLDESEQQEYLCVMGEESAGAVWRNQNTTSSITLDKNGVRTREQQCYLAARFVDEHPFEALLACAISIAPDVSARPSSDFCRTLRTWWRLRCTTFICCGVCARVPLPWNARVFPASCTTAWYSHCTLLRSGYMPCARSRLYLLPNVNRSCLKSSNWFRTKPPTCGT